MSNLGFARQQHPLLDLLRKKRAGQRNELEKFLFSIWDQLSAKCWQSYENVGRGAQFVSLSDKFWRSKNGELPLEYLELFSCYGEELVNGPFTPMGNMGRLIEAVCSYDPKTEIVVVCRWKGWSGFSVSILKSELSTPRENYLKNGEGFTLKKRYYRETNPNIELQKKGFLDQNQIFHWFFELKHEFWLAQAWKGYLEKGRGILSISIEAETSIGKTSELWMAMNVPFGYAGERGELNILDPFQTMEKGISDPIGLYEILTNYDPEKQAVLEFQWAHTPKGVVRFVADSLQLSPPECYELQKEYID